MTIEIEHEAADSGPVPEERSNPHTGENQPPHDGLCANVRCRKGPNGTRGILKSRRAKYCCAYCRVAVCRRKGKSGRKRRRDAKHGSAAERQRALRSRKTFRRMHTFRSDWADLRAAALRDNRPAEPGIDIE